MKDAAIRVSGLRKEYDGVIAVDGIDFEVYPGEVFGLLGPNGAGKTTTLECLEGLRGRDAGDVRVLGIDPDRDSRRLFGRIGVQLQVGSLPANLTAREAIKLFAAYHGVTPDHEPLERLGLDPEMGTQYGDLSTGQKRRVDLALAVIHHPDVLFLDEPTAGLDVSSRIALHQLIRELRRGGTTIVLSTHDMAEAEALADRVAILLRGRVAAIGSPRELTATGNGLTKVSVRTLEGALLSQTVPGFEVQGDYAVGFTAEPGPTVNRLINHVASRGDTLVDLRVERPSLEERFLEMIHGESA